MKTFVAFALLALSGASALAAPSQVGAIRAKLAAVEAKRFARSGTWSVRKSIDASGVHRFTGNRPLGSGRGLLTVRYAEGTYRLKAGQAVGIRVTKMGTAY